MELCSVWNGIKNIILLAFVDQDATGFRNPTEVMGALRRWKDGWKG